MGICFEYVLSINDNNCPALGNTEWKFMMFGKFLNPYADHRLCEGNVVFETQFVFVPIFCNNHTYASPISVSSEKVCEFIEEMNCYH